MARTLKGIVTSTKMQGTITVEVTNRIPHPLYKKLLKRSKKYKVAVNGEEVVVGQEVKIEEAKKMAEIQEKAKATAEKTSDKVSPKGEVKQPRAAKPKAPDKKGTSKQIVAKPAKKLVEKKIQKQEK